MAYFNFAFLPLSKNASSNLKIFNHAWNIYYKWVRTDSTDFRIHFQEVTSGFQFSTADWTWWRPSLPLRENEFDRLWTDFDHCPFTDFSIWADTDNRTFRSLDIIRAITPVEESLWYFLILMMLTPSIESIVNLALIFLPWRNLKT